MSSSKPSIASLQTQVTELQQQRADDHALILALKAQVDTLSPPAAAPAEAPAKSKGKRAAKPKKEKNPDAPKRAPTAFFAFNASERAKSPDEKLTASILSERWKLLSKEQQDAYKPAAASEAAASASEAE
jgi:hypothetical protein|uniref:HMG box domain-containing protein n=1 Tax=viral metagenome TaxID=1070528 RepID=A0A6C0LQY2_9ZZZZ